MSDYPDFPALAGVASEDAPGIRGSFRRVAAPDALEPATAGRTTLAGLPWGAAPPQLVPPFLTPEGVTVLYGPGGVGKGYLALYLVREVVRTNRRVTILDFENHPREWGRRAHALGFEDVDLAMVDYLAPFSPQWTKPRGSLAEISDTVREELDDPKGRSDYVVVDSFTTGASSENELGGARAAQEFFIGVARLGRPALVIAHVAGGGEKWPAKPFGSVFVHNLARETWAVERTGTPTDAEDTEDGAPMFLELRQRKSNAGTRAKPQFVTFTFEGGKTRVDRGAPLGKTLADLAFGILARATKPMTVAELRSALKADEDRVVSGEALRKTLERARDRFTRSEDIPYKWGRA